MTTALLDPEPLWLAHASRDARFDGRFFTGVKTTGIYCRPICPAKTPLRKNVRFFSCAAAAEQAGFRPCRRCRPETSPGSPAWLGTSSTVSRALRLIEDGALDAGGVDMLAERLGVGARHLRRLFDDHVGASPLAVAQTRRVHFARLLLDSSALPIGEIAMASGFASLRRFQSAFRATFGRAPSSVRARRIASSTAAAVPALHLPVRPPYDWDATFAFLAGRAVTGVEVVDGRSWRRTFESEGRGNTLEAHPTPNGDALLLRFARPPGRDLAHVVERVRRAFDLGANPTRITAHLAGDRTLARLVRARPGLRLPCAWSPFEACVRAIVGQQISVAGARTILGRLAERCGEPLPANGATFDDEAPLARQFPTPKLLAQANLDSLGLPRARAATLGEVARRVVNGDVRLDGSVAPEEMERALLDIPGIGPWTVRYVRLRGQGDPDVFLPDDLGVRRALATKDGRLPAVKDAEARAAAWSPWRSYAVLHLWAASPAHASARSKKGKNK